MLPHQYLSETRIFRFWCSAHCLCSSAAKRSTNNQYVCKYIGRINDQSNRSRPFSLVVMTLDFRSRGTWFDPRLRHSTEIFSLQVYISYYYIWCRVLGWLPSEPKGPFSLVVMTLDYRSRGTWFDPRSGHSTGIFSLQVYFSYYYSLSYLAATVKSVIIPYDILLRYLFVLKFYGPVNPMGSCRVRSVYLTTRLLGRLSPLSG